MQMVLLAALLVAADLPPTPRLLVNAADLAALRAKVARPGWAARWSGFRADVDRAVAEPLALPPRGGNWSHNYVCPDHGARLKQGRRLGPWQWEHTCPVGPHTLLGNPAKATLDFDGNAIAGVHGQLAQQACDAGLLWQMTREPRYLARAKAILAAYAEHYLKYELHDNQGRLGRGARVHSQSLTEASWLIPIAQAADLVWADSSAQERAAVEAGLLRPCVERVLLPGFGQVHNIHCRLASAIGLTGLLLGDQQLVDRATADTRGGFRQQVAKGIQDDGMWFEGASGYHFFTIDGLMPLAIAAEHCGVNLWSPRLKTMFDAPLALATPDLLMPAFNDSGTVDLKGRRDSYDLAYAKYHDPAYLPLLAGGPRTGRLALLYGEAELPQAGAAAVRGSANSPASGYAMLQAGDGEGATWLCLKYGPHGGGHGHPDKNHFVLRTQRADRLPDSGSHAYGSPLHGSWDKTTLAHNTLVVDEANQAPATGSCLGFSGEAGLRYVVTDAGPIYPGVSFRRAAVLLSDTVALIVDRVVCDKPRTLDLAVHLSGAWADLPAGQPWTPPAKAGYQHLAKATTRGAGQGLSLSVKPAAGADTVLSLAPGEATEALCGVGVGASTAEQPPMVLFRRQAAATWYAWTVALDGVAALVTCQPDGERATVNVTHGQQRWALDVEPVAGLVRRR
ncbi:MAG: heparinase II/III family protein [Armatimonadetes bacterium]|nr:heparinase II/III family protein [Armatimonadota bacterium]